MCLRKGVFIFLKKLTAIAKEATARAAALEVPLTCLRLKASSGVTSISSLSLEPSPGRLGFSSSSVTKSSVLSLCSVPPRSFLVNNLAGRKRDWLT